MSSRFGRAVPLMCLTSALRRILHTDQPQSHSRGILPLENLSNQRTPWKLGYSLFAWMLPSWTTVISTNAVNRNYSRGCISPSHFPTWFSETPSSRPITIFPQPPLCKAVSNSVFITLMLWDNKAGPCNSIILNHSQPEEVEASFSDWLLLTWAIALLWNKTYCTFEQLDGRSLVVVAHER